MSRAALEKRLHELGPAQAAAVRRLAKLLKSPEQERLALALEDLTQPHLRLKDMTDEVLRLLKENKGEEAQQCYKEYKAVAIAPPAPDGRGKLLLDWAKDWGPKLEALCGRDGAKLREGAKYSGAFVKARAPLLQGARDEHERRWQRGGSQRLAMTKLRSYSSFLADYHRAKVPNPGPLSALELPGQYTGDAEPNTDCHVTLECLADELLVLESMRLPKRLTFFCSDQTERRFLIKGGEDLRLDQRVQQLLGAMNATLDASAPCAARGLRMRTYTVAPLSTSAGLLEWMDGTTTLQSFMKDAINKQSDVRRAKEESQALDRAHMKYAEHYGKCAQNKKLGAKAFANSMITETDKPEFARKRLEVCTALQTQDDRTPRTTGGMRARPLITGRAGAHAAEPARARHLGARDWRGAIPVHAVQLCVEPCGPHRGAVHPRHRRPSPR